jgi:hypothetical protein
MGTSSRDDKDGEMILGDVCKKKLGDNKGQHGL